MSSITVASANIPANEKSSNEIDLGTSSLVALEMPEAFNGTTITFQSKAKPQINTKSNQASEDWDDVYDSGGTQVSWTVAANRVVVPTAAHAAALAPLRYIRLVAATGQNPGREFRLILKEN